MRKPETSSVPVISSFCVSLNESCQKWEGDVLVDYSRADDIHNDFLCLFRDVALQLI